LTPRIITSGNTTYEWTVPASTGLTVIDGTSNSSITLQTTGQGTINGNAIKLTVTNSVGSVSANMLGTLKVLGDGHPGPDLVVGPNAYHTETFTYQTWVFPDTIGTWMITNSKEGTPTYTTYPGHEPGERGYYYNRNDAATACPNGWTMPALSKARYLLNFIGGWGSSSTTITIWGRNTIAGVYDYTQVWTAWDGMLVSHVADDDWLSRLSYNPRAGTFGITSTAFSPREADCWSVRCVKLEQ
jgi:hypothetical protein